MWGSTQEHCYQCEGVARDRDPWLPADLGSLGETARSAVQDVTDSPTAAVDEAAAGVVDGSTAISDAITGLPWAALSRSSRGQISRQERRRGAGRQRPTRVGGAGSDLDAIRMLTRGVRTGDRHGTDFRVSLIQVDGVPTAIFRFSRYWRISGL